MDYLQEDYYPPSTPIPTPESSTLQPYAPDPYNGMPPPPTAAYPDLPSLMNACQDHGRRHGYACVTSSNNYKRGIAYVRCDRGGEYVNHWKVTDESRVRKNRTRRLVGCKWKARAKRNAEGLWVLSMMHDKHTGHDPSSNTAAHPSLRQLPGDAVEAAKGAFGSGKTPKEVLEILQRGWNPSVTAQDVYNLKAKITRLDSAKGTPARPPQTTQPDVTVDPALEAENPNVATSPPPGPGLIAYMQDSTHAHPSAPQTPQTPQTHQPGPNGHSAARKCPCTCCEH